MPSLQSKLGWRGVRAHGVSYLKIQRRDIVIGPVSVLWYNLVAIQRFSSLKSSIFSRLLLQYMR